MPDNEGVSPLELCAQENTTVPLTYSSFPGGGDQNLRGNSYRLFLHSHILVQGGGINHLRVNDAVSINSLSSHLSVSFPPEQLP